MNKTGTMNGNAVLAGSTERVKQLLLTIVGMLVSGTNLYGFNPVGVGFLSALSMDKGSGMLSIVALMIGMTNDFDALAIIKM